MCVQIEQLKVKECKRDITVTGILNYAVEVGQSVIAETTIKCLVDWINGLYFEGCQEWYLYSVPAVQTTVILFNKIVNNGRRPHCRIGDRLWVRIQWRGTWEGLYKDRFYIFRWRLKQSMRMRWLRAMIEPWMMPTSSFIENKGMRKNSKEEAKRLLC